MSNNNPLFILLVGATILSLILVTGSIYAFAQEEEEDKDDKDEKDEKDEEKDEESKDKDEDEKDEEKDKEEESKDEDVENNNDTATQIIQDQLTPPPVNNDTTATIVNTTTTFQEPEPIIAITAPPPPPTEEEGEFNATCQCKTTSKKPKSPSNDPTDDEQIIPITSANIKDSKSFGQVTDPAYTSFYTVPNLLDTIINDISFWSQAGQSSFYIHLDDTLDNYQVCSAELNIHNPKSTPYLLDVGVSKNYTGVIDQTKERIQFDKCVKNMDEIYMTFDSQPGSYISISEIKLFGSKVGAQTTTIPPTLQPPLITETEEETENATKINIENSNAEIDIKNSTVTFKFDPMTATFVQQTGTK